MSNVHLMTCMNGRELPPFDRWVPSVLLPGAWQGLSNPAGQPLVLQLDAVQQFVRFKPRASAAFSRLQHRSWANTSWPGELCMPCSRQLPLAQAQAISKFLKDRWTCTDSGGAQHFHSFVACTLHRASLKVLQRQLCIPPE